MVRLPERQRKVIELLKQKGEITLAHLKEASPGMPERTLRKDVEDLRKAGLLIAQGEKKGRRYALR